MKRFVNDPKNFVAEVLAGIAAANPDTLLHDPEFNLIVRADAPVPGKVAIVQGSGSGHEPAHVMNVGVGMLDIACPGDIFAAPPLDNVLEAIRRVSNDKGVLLLVNNYTGDRMVFEMAQEVAEAEGVNAELLFIDDDVAVENSTYTIGRRGVAGNFFVIKAVGAAAEAGMDLGKVREIGERVNSQMRSMGMALTACTPPARGEPLFDLADDEVEFGVGIHGEPGRKREKMREANAIVDELVSVIAADKPFESGAHIAVMVNGLGGTPISELYLLYGHVHKLLNERGLIVERSYIGDYCTALDMAGASITLLELDDEISKLLDAPAASALRVF
ncbi:dihydroxyacetone kinase subunit DhaK [Mycolicibacterium palauense]|uniref:dihydroxyacetone kinase subunit DhaK n=1 Tax=Mycolicibacterium palauense TaxID=2034511 RepID=UPI000BFF01D8|nr:dihydroxyacetone kinase subunit DhaK [Mycolicibacterium palauense]